MALTVTRTTCNHRQRRNTGAQDLFCARPIHGADVHHCHMADPLAKYANKRWYYPTVTGIVPAADPTLITSLAIDYMEAIARAEKAADALEAVVARQTNRAAFLAGWEAFLQTDIATQNPGRVDSLRQMFNLR